MDELLRSARLIAILRKLPFSHMAAAGEALYAGGVRLAEVTMESDNALAAIDVLRQQGLTVGAGTVLDGETAERAIAHGAVFLVTPCIRADVIETARKHRVPVITGTLTPTEIWTAYELGSTYVKVFPAGSLGPAYIRDVMGPLGHVPLVPSGGVTLDNARSFLDAGAIAVGVGSALTDRKLLENHDFAGLAERARAYVRAVAAGV
ncbi:2-dehydro-3-deoxy-phosphogluconate aldolase [Alicyclobacillus contaminans]|uniref:bifunctional 4-hydroxy-2-oxoglutarate aldolase/2-dehydro-3-deoxy-phosphogluconate aldolase n=1 Tax=Alicyclobacillus contaminans TaxID=392016 RepID=UPI00047ECFCE|nr:bifunctional 4-hydroxy-2-oxoglutarate aldolase/2-dehydro-3-deoxy-phosphogluconate aldolase [Alicyclobacillus contaminans]GMA51413.1 2-dehydro-3-deoxy-phosphogluconate aldolase [Alicyclobacillus contaminans]